MPYLKNALGGLGRSVTDTARQAFGHADAPGRWRKLALYAAVFALPGGSLAVLLFMWAGRRRARATATTQPVVAALPSLPPCAPARAACRASQACETARVPAPALAALPTLKAIDALRRWRRNDA